MVTTKLVVGVGSTGLAISAGTGSYFYFTSNYTIEQLLNKENPKKENLKKGLSNKKDWLTKWKDYVTTNKESDQLKAKDTWNLKGWSTIGKNEGEVPEVFAEKCEEKLNDKVTNSKDPKYLEFIKWCIK